MRFRLSMMNNRGKSFDEIIIANNLRQAKINVKRLNPESQIPKAFWVYK